MTDTNIATIDPRGTCLTLINVYEVEPEKQAVLAEALQEATLSTIRHQPGFVSVCVHSSRDGHRVVNYAQWASKGHFEAFMRHPDSQDLLKRFADLARSVAPGLYKVDTVEAAGLAG